MLSSHTVSTNIWDLQEETEEAPADQGSIPVFSSNIKKKQKQNEMYVSILCGYVDHH